VRMGGDEFAVLQTGIEGRRDIGVLADKLLAAIGAPIHALAARSKSAPASAWRSAPQRLDRRQISADADRALYQAKAAGGRRCVVAAPDGDRAARLAPSAIPCTGRPRSARSAVVVVQRQRAHCPPCAAPNSGDIAAVSERRAWKQADRAPRFSGRWIAIELLVVANLIALAFETLPTCLRSGTGRCGTSSLLRRGLHVEYAIRVYLRGPAGGTSSPSTGSSTCWRSCLLPDGRAQHAGVRAFRCCGCCDCSS